MAARLTTYIVVAIVAATLIAGLIVGAQRDDSSGPVDLIVHNATVYTADRYGSMAEAIAVRGNQILRVGREREIMRLRRPQTTVIDAGGAAVLPGFNDAHAHAIDAGLALDGVELLGATTVEQMQDRLIAWAETHPERLWVTGRGWTHDALENDGPTRVQLDYAVMDRPVRLLSADGREAWINSKAIELTGIARDPRAAGGLVRDARGEPTGLVRDGAVALVERHVPAPSREDRARALRAAIGRAHEHGVTSLQNIGGGIADVELFDEAVRDRALSMRVYFALSLKAPLDRRTADRLDAIRKKHGDDPLFKTGAISVEIDGPVDTQSAALLEPYATRIGLSAAAGPGVPGRGTARLSPAQLQRIVLSMDARGWQMIADATGDRAVRMALDAYEAAAAANSLPARGRRHRIEGLEIVGPDDLPRFDALGVIASMQPFAANAEMGSIGLWGRSLGPERAARGWAAASLAKAGAHLAFGSGWPARPVDPMLALHAAVARRTPDGSPDGGWYPDERLTLKSAINAYTSGAAWASFDEHRKGMIRPGMLADLVVLSDDIFAAPADALAATTVEVTIFDGKVIYRRNRHHATD